MTYRVVHCGTGWVGSVALEAILRNPELELVGHYVSSPEKAGKDSGALIGQPAAGIIATNDWSELIALKADCLIYFGNSAGREEEAIADLAPFLRNGTNAITYSGFAIAHPQTTPPHLRDLIEGACREGASTCFFTGIDPGWATTDLAIAALAAADQVDCVRVCELGDLHQYTAEYVMREYFGFGQDKSQTPLLVSGDYLKKHWSPTLHHIADALGTEIEEIRVVWDRDFASKDLQTGFGLVKAGTCSLITFQLQGLNQGKPFVILEHVDWVDPDLDHKWKRPHRDVPFVYRVEVEGKPSFHLELSWRREDAALLSAMPLINAVPAVCEASPGLKGPLDIPRYWSRKRVRR